MPPNDVVQAMGGWVRYVVGGMGLLALAMVFVGLALGLVAGLRWGYDALWTAWTRWRYGMDRRG